MQNDEEVKKIVRDKYSSIAEGKTNSCLSKSCCSNDEVVFNIQDSYEAKQGYVKDADLGLGCGIPTDFANIKEGETVVDLGSGAGNDVFVARSFTGNSGTVIGIDMTESMIKKANENLKKTGFENIEFKLGEIENIPVANNTADIVISNCVLNLVPDKTKAFNEMYRITKPGGRFCISDLVLKGDLPESLRKSAELYAGCVSGALQMDEYLGIIGKAGFKNIEVKKSRPVEVPDNALESLGVLDESRKFKESGGGIFSITVVGYK